MNRLTYLVGEEKGFVGCVENWCCFCKGCWWIEKLDEDRFDEKLNI